MEIHELVVGPLKTNCYIVTSDMNHAVIIDPGFDAEKIAAKIRELGAKPKFMLLTHGHFDHIGAVNALKKTFPEMKSVILAEDEDICLNPGLINNEIGVVTKPDMLFADGDIVKLDDLDFKFMATPGHTKGCACIIVEDKIFTGDTLFSRGYGRTDLYGGSTRDMKMSLKKIGAIEGDYEIYPAHGPHSTLKTEKYANPYLRKAMGLGI
ncbi:MAG: MBL fold metallo-hydrolase [Oscillospiraceae bacterium]|nr:MBL fold metallo-hydrolase [Oscillospiraceae bacterium]MBQ5666668.1 MBL fold metallo-hydrolase [Oscillospiraceae bacterium]